MTADTLKTLVPLVALAGSIGLNIYQYYRDRNKAKKDELWKKKYEAHTRALNLTNLILSHFSFILKPRHSPPLVEQRQRLPFQLAEAQQLYNQTDFLIPKEIRETVHEFVFQAKQIQDQFIKCQLIGEDLRMKVNDLYLFEDKLKELISEDLGLKELTKEMRRDTSPPPFDDLTEAIRNKNKL